MKVWTGYFLVIIFSYVASSCHSTKKLQTAVNKRDTTIVNTNVKPIDSSASAITTAKLVLNNLNQIDFKTFSAKTKVQYEDQNGKQPDFNAIIRLQKDSVLWISISATFLGIEAFRLYITPDTLIILDKLDKTVSYHSFDYVESVAHIPMDFSILQNIIVGNLVYAGDSIVSYHQTANHTLIGTVGDFFKNLITLTADNRHLERIKLDDIDIHQNRTASLLYNDYEKNNQFDFSVSRQISVSVKSKVDINILFKQYEFNKDLSFPFNIPRNYKTK